MPDLISVLLIAGVGVGLIAATRMKKLSAGAKGAMMVLGIVGIFAGAAVYLSGVTLIPQALAAGAVPQPSGVVAVFDARIKTYTTFAGPTTFVKPDGSAATGFATVTVWSTAIVSQSDNVTFMITNLNSGQFGSQNTWQGIIKLASADLLNSVGSAYPYIYNRSTSDPTQWSITWPQVGSAFVSFSNTIRDYEVIGGTYGSSGLVSALLADNTADTSKMVVGVPYCGYFQVVGAPLTVCHVGTA